MKYEEGEDLILQYEKFLVVCLVWRGSYTIFACLNRVVPDGRDSTMVIFNAAYLIAHDSTTTQGRSNPLAFLSFSKK